MTAKQDYETAIRNYFIAAKMWIEATGDAAERIQTFGNEAVRLLKEEARSAEVPIVAMDMMLRATALMTRWAGQRIALLTLLVSRGADEAKAGADRAGLPTIEEIVAAFDRIAHEELKPEP